LEWYFNFAPDLELVLNEASKIISVIRKGQNFAVVHFPENLTRFQIRDTWFSYQYGIKQPSHGIYAQWCGELSDVEKIFHWWFQLANENIDENKRTV
jgi:hypothetical protein